MRQMTKSHFNRPLEVLCRNWRIFQKDNCQLALYVTQREASGVKAMIVWFKCKGVQSMEKKTLSSNETRKKIFECFPTPTSESDAIKEQTNKQKNFHLLLLGVDIIQIVLIASKKNPFR